MRLRQIMDSHVGVERDAEGLRTALRAIAALEAAAPPEAQGFRNMTAAATLIAAGALRREESRGGHARSDFPRTVPEAHETRLTLAEALAIRDAA
jgi:L-aspartate oxidase